MRVILSLTRHFQLCEVDERLCAERHANALFLCKRNSSYWRAKRDFNSSLSQARSSQLMMIGRQGTFAINLVRPLPSLLDKKTHFTLVPIVFIGTECATVLLTDSQHFTVRNIVGCPAVVLNSNSYHCDVCVV